MWCVVGNIIYSESFVYWVIIKQQTIVFWWICTPLHPSWLWPTSLALRSLSWTFVLSPLSAHTPWPTTRSWPGPSPSSVFLPTVPWAINPRFLVWHVNVYSFAPSLPFQLIFKSVKKASKSERRSEFDLSCFYTSAFDAQQRSLLTLNVVLLLSISVF